MLAYIFKKNYIYLPASKAVIKGSDIVCGFSEDSGQHRSPTVATGLHGSH